MTQLEAWFLICFSTSCWYELIIQWPRIEWNMSREEIFWIEKLDDLKKWNKWKFCEGGMASSEKSVACYKGIRLLSTNVFACCTCILFCSSLHYHLLKLLQLLFFTVISHCKKKKMSHNRNQYVVFFTAKILRILMIDNLLLYTVFLKQDNFLFLYILP